MTDVEILKKKIARFCAWRERCSFEVGQKLRELGAQPAQIQQIIKWLATEGYLDDLRFSQSFASGKLEYNQWGRIKIKQELLARNISRQIIDEALEKIDQEKYLNIAASLAHNKWETLKDENSYIRKQKTMAYLAGKGFENDIIYSVTSHLPKSGNTED